MESFEILDNTHIQIKIDPNLYGDNVITKTLYWLSDSYCIFQKKEDNRVIVNIEKLKGQFSIQEQDRLKKRICQDLIDFKTRDIVTKETKNIREILLIKAFANNDDFEDYNLLD